MAAARTVGPGRVGVAPTILETDELFAALRTLRLGGADSTSRHLPISPQAQAAIPPALNAVRWSAITYGMIFGAQRAFGGSYSIVVSLAICLFLTSWRGILPIEIGADSPTQRITSLSDVVMFGVAVGISGGPTSPFIYCLLVALVVPALGWSYRIGVTGWVLGWVATLAATGLFADSASDDFGRVLGAVAAASAALVIAAAFTREKLIESEEHRSLVTGQITALSEANDLLSMLNSVARTLPMSLSQREAIDSARRQLVDTFDGQVLCLLEYTESNDEWVPKLAEGVAVRTAYSSHDLPAHLRQAADSSEPWLVSDLTLGTIRGLDANSGSGLYAKLSSRGRTVGLLGIEHRTPGRYDESDRFLLSGMADILALTLDNARWFGRLRTLGAEEERLRIARDLHDRLGQWLTYISFELERYIATDGGEDPQLHQLYNDVQTALDELRETLRQLRTTVTEGRGFPEIAAEHIRRFSDRTGVEVTFEVDDPDARLSVPVENELLRILQEALNNVDKHAKATEVRISWQVNDRGGSLRIVDNGRGFDPSRGVRESAYGLVGMRERADVIGARISIDSAPERGTTVYVHAGVTPATKEG